MMNRSVVVIAGLVFLAACNTSPNIPENANTDHHFWVSSTNMTREVTIIDPDGARQTVTAFVDADGRLVYQGDMILGDVSGLSPQGVYETRTNLWTGKTVYYRFGSTLTATARQDAINAMNHIKTNLGINFVQRTNQRDYVLFVDDSGCASYVGRIGGAQRIWLNSRCGFGGAVHEIGHALSLHHEMVRKDRDNYVQIIWANIPSNWQSQYQIVSTSRAYGPYDYDSIMHYPAYFNGQIAIQPLDSSISLSRLGQRNGLSSGDVNVLRALYP